MTYGLKTMSHEDFLALKADAEIIESDQYGEKVLRLTDGRFLKLFRRKRLITSTALYPYALRFVDNAEELARAGGGGIPVPRVIEAWRIPSLKLDAVLYWPLEGNNLRTLVRQGFAAETEKRMKRLFTDFVIYLHSLGIYFRSLHLGNVILTPDGRLGLIDFSDLCIYNRPLPVFMCRRNIQRMQKSAEERDWVGSEAIIKAALNNSESSIWPGFLVELALQRLQKTGIFRSKPRKF
ncbi:MAG: toluene tolerance protein [Betaproteobacteria bacterium]|nr:toluene tolerance protein [Betaproteobacteria bacterium]